MLIALVNESTVVDAPSAQLIAHACASQLRYHAAPVWERQPASVIYYSSLTAVPVGADVVALFDDADQQGALGYHDETPDGRPYGKVFAKTVLGYGGKVLTGALSVAVTTSHEVLELFGDPNVNLWVDDGGGNEIAVELCDPVEDDAYVIKVWNGHQYIEVAVSNFVTRDYFDKQARAGARLDYLQSLTTPWSFTKGGYLIVRTAGDITQKFNYTITAGDDVPVWKRDLKLNEAARTFKRISAPAVA